MSQLNSIDVTDIELMIDREIGNFNTRSTTPFSRKYSEISAIDKNGFCWAKLVDTFFILHPKTQVELKIPIELNRLVEFGKPSVSTFYSKTILFPLAEGYFLNQQGMIFSSYMYEVSKQNGKYGLKNSSDDYYHEAKELETDSGELAFLTCIYNRSKRWLLDPVYEEINYEENAYDSSNEIYFKVKQNGKYGIYSSLGRMILDPIFKSIELFDYENSERFPMLFLVRLKKSGIYDSQGNLLVNLRYSDFDSYNDFSYTSNFLEGFFPLDGKKKGFIDVNGNEIIPPIHDQIDAIFFNESTTNSTEILEIKTTFTVGEKYPFSYYLIGIDGNEKFTFYSPTGQKLATHEIDEMLDFSPSGFISFVHKNYVGLLGPGAQLVLPVNKTAVFFNNLWTESIVVIENQDDTSEIYSILNTDLEPYFQQKMDYIQADRNPTRLLVGIEGKFGVLDLLNSSFDELVWVIPLEYEWISQLNQVEYVVKKNGKYGLVDEMNRPLIAFNYDEINWFSVDLYRVKQNNNYGILNRNQQVVLPVEFDSIQKLISTASDHSLFFCKRNGIWKIYNSSTSTWLSVDPIQAYQKQVMYHLPVRLNGKWGVLDVSGNFVIPAEYDSIEITDFPLEFTVTKNKTTQVLGKDYQPIVKKKGKK